MAPLTWIVALESRGARIFQTKGRSAHLSLVQTFSHPIGKEPSSHINTDRQGKRRSPGAGSFHSFSPHVDPHEQENKRFVKEIAHYLQASPNGHHFERLILVAPPHLLGDLRKALPEPLKKKVLQELAKEIPFDTKENKVIEFLVSHLELIE